MRSTAIGECCKPQHELPVVQLKRIVCGTYWRFPNASNLLLLCECLAKVVGQKVAPEVEFREVDVASIVQLVGPSAL